MKRLLFLSSFLLILTVASFAQTSVSANVQKVSGIPVFVYAEPLKDYDVSFKKEIKMVWTNDQINSINEIVKKLCDMCAKQAEKEKLEYDAIIIDDMTATAIKYK